ncbi:hypothetical protein ES706_02050 [subsurface metagenome]
MLELIVDGDDTEKLTFEVRKMVNAGFTGRDLGEVQKHIDELRKCGVTASQEIPAFYPMLPDRITTSERIKVLPDSKTSGEVEYVLLLDGDNIYVTVGSDHTDRELEKHSIPMSKQIYFNVIAPKVWRYEDVKGHWDDLILRAWVEENGQRQLYQEGKLGKIIRPEELIEKVQSRVTGDLRGIVIYSGTLPTIGGGLCFSSRFEMELIDEHVGRAIRYAYSAEPIAWFRC